MIFTLFLLCAFNVENACTDSGTPYSGIAACAHTTGNDGCYAECETACLAEVANTNAAACEGALKCFDGTTTHLYIPRSGACAASEAGDANCDDFCLDHCANDEDADPATCLSAFPCTDSVMGNANIENAAACIAAISGGAIARPECVAPCRTFCTTTGDTTNCPPVLACFDATNKVYYHDADACTHSVGAGADARCKKNCLEYCVADDTAVVATCIAANPCESAPGTAIPDSGACAAVVAASPNLACVPQCRKECRTNKQADAATCGPALTCKAATSPFAPLAGKPACVALEGTSSTSNDAANLDCTAQCIAYCVSDKAADFDECATALPCKNGGTARTGDDICVGATDTKNAQGVVTAVGDAYCVAPCRKRCSTVKEADATKCNAALPCLVGETPAPAVGDAICVAATATGSGGTATPADTDCIAQCRDHCVNEFTADPAKCIAALPCKAAGGTALADEDTCLKAGGSYTPAPMNAEAADIDCTAPCRKYCFTAETPVEESCEGGLTCKAAASPFAPLTGAPACTGLKGSGQTPGNKDCALPCLDFCTGASPSVPDCEGALPCWDGAGKKPLEGAPACKKFKATTSDANCEEACTTYCTGDPCTETKKPDCGTECTAWCQVAANTENELCKSEEEGGYSIVLSLFVLLVALL